MEKGSPSTVGHASAYHASGSPNPSGVGSPSIYDSSPINPEFFGTEQVSVVEKGVVYDLGLPVAPNTPISSNPTGVEAANDNASLIAHYSDLEHVTDDSTTVADGEAPPAYHQLTIEGAGGNVSAEVMRMQLFHFLSHRTLLITVIRKWTNQHAHQFLCEDTRTRVIIRTSIKPFF
jgi:hypothetical protein